MQPSPAMGYKVSVQLMRLPTALQTNKPSRLRNSYPPPFDMPALQTVHESRPVLGHVYVCAILRSGGVR